MTYKYSSPDYWREAELETTPRAIALFAASWGVLLSAETATAISDICTTIMEEGE